MGNGRDSSGLILGLIIGTLIALVILSRNSQQTRTSPVQYTSSQRLDNQYDSQQFKWQPMDIPRVDDIKPQIIQPPVIQAQQDPKLIEMVSQLQKTSSQLEQTTSKLQELQETMSKLKQDSVSQLPQVIVQQQSDHQSIQTNTQMQKPEAVQSSQMVQPIQPSQMTQHMQDQQIYKNSEKWQIIRGKDGRIKSLDIVRDVKKSN